jgi:hypothetical protein
VGWRTIEVEVVLLDVLAVITLTVGQSEQPFLEDRIAPVPKRQRETEQLAVIRDAGRARPHPTMHGTARYRG